MAWAPLLDPNGAVGTVLMGVILFSESLDAARLGWIALVAAGIVGLGLQGA
jgi:quaternary ammonium compound-resistance protein SugE